METLCDCVYKDDLKEQFEVKMNVDKLVEVLLITSEDSKLEMSEIVLIHSLIARAK